MPYHPSDLQSRLDQYPEGHRGYATPGVKYPDGEYRAGEIEKPVVNSERPLDRRMGYQYGQKIKDTDPYHENYVPSKMHRPRKKSKALSAEAMKDEMVQASKKIMAIQTTMRDRMADAKDPNSYRRTRGGSSEPKHMQGHQENRPDVNIHPAFYHGQPSKKLMRQMNNMSAVDELLEFGHRRKVAQFVRDVTGQSTQRAISGVAKAGKRLDAAKSGGFIKRLKLALPNSKASKTLRQAEAQMDGSIKKLANVKSRTKRRRLQTATAAGAGMTAIGAAGAMKSRNGKRAPKGYHYMPDGRLMKDSDHR